MSEKELKLKQSCFFFCHRLHGDMKMEVKTIFKSN